MNVCKLKKKKTSKKDQFQDKIQTVTDEPNSITNE